MKEKQSLTSIFFSQEIIFFKSEPKKVANIYSLGTDLKTIFSSNFVDPDPHTFNTDPDHCPFHVVIIYHVTNDQ